MNQENLKHYCRHCRGKLLSPTANPRDAFDSKGCHRSFYRHRCLACEREMPRNHEKQKVCYRAECKQKWAQKTIQSRFLGSDSGPEKYPSKNFDFIGVREPVRSDRGADWAIAVNSSRIRAPRRVLDAAFGPIPVLLTNQKEL
jgi:hypothetical protein